MSLMSPVLWIVAGVACGLAMLVVLGMCWVHADWTAGNRLVHLGLAVALGAGGGECFRRGFGASADAR